MCAAKSGTPSLIINQRGKVVPVTLREHYFGHGELALVDLYHGEDCQVVENRRDSRHQDHVEIRDLEELRDQERCGAEPPVTSAVACMPGTSLDSMLAIP